MLSEFCVAFLYRFDFQKRNSITASSIEKEKENQKKRIPKFDQKRGLKLNLRDGLC